MDDLGGGPPVATEAMLDAARSVAARRDARWPRRPLSPALRLLLWALRVYVVLMLAVVVVQLARLA